MRIALGMAFVATVICVAPALGQDQAAPPPVTNEREVIICKVLPSTTGTRLGARRSCRTKREWDERREMDRQVTEDAQRRDSRQPCFPSGVDCP
jgi:hypothetical protein